MDAQKAESVRTEAAKLKQQQLTQEAEGLALAYLYQSYDLKAEAIELYQFALTLLQMKLANTRRMTSDV